MPRLRKTEEELETYNLLLPKGMLERGRFYRSPAEQLADAQELEQCIAEARAERLAKEKEKA